MNTKGSQPYESTFAERICALGGILGPVTFIASWAVLGEIATDYSPVSDAISELARTNRSTHVAMTAAFLAFAIGTGAFAWTLRRRINGNAWKIATTTAITTVGVACTPLGSPQEPMHFFFAGLAYVSLALLPIVAARSFAGVARKASYGIGAATACCLLTSVIGSESVHGLFQRSGFTVGDLWIIATSIWLLRSSGRVASR